MFVSIFSFLFCDCITRITDSNERAVYDYDQTLLDGLGEQAI